MENNILVVENLCKSFPLKGKAHSRISAIDNVSLSVSRGETLGVVGESGCGKTTLGRAILRLNEPDSGKIIFDGSTIFNSENKTYADMLTYRRKMQIVFQNPHTSLNPRMTAGEIVGEAIDIHKLAKSKSERSKRIDELLNLVGLNPEQANRYPHEFSSGQQQRIAIARALSVGAEFLVLDEPVSSLDVSIQGQIVNMLKDMQKDLGLTYLFIAHDLSIVRHISDRIAVMYLGTIVELATSAEIFSCPIHPYTRLLLGSIPSRTPKSASETDSVALGGNSGDSLNASTGCSFCPRCIHAKEICRQRKPELKEYAPGHKVACHLVD